MPLFFLYGTSLPGQPDHGWIADLPRAEGTARGRLWCDKRRRPALVPDPRGKLIHGILVDVPDVRLPVLDLIEGGVPRRLLRVSRSLRSVEAWAWTLDAKTARKNGYRPTDVTAWS